MVGNKIDRISEKESKGMKELEEYCGGHQIDFMEISALNETNLDALKRKIFGYFNAK